jgi:hypothetical protein
MGVIEHAFAFAEQALERLQRQADVVGVGREDCVRGGAASDRGQVLAAERGRPGVEAELAVGPVDVEDAAAALLTFRYLYRNTLRYAVNGGASAEAR